MSKIGIFFGSDTGTTRRIAKKIAQKLGDEIAEKPVNVNRAAPEDLMSYNALILGSPSYGEGELPGFMAGTDESWGEFLPKLQDQDWSGKTIAIFGLGDQNSFPDTYTQSMRELYKFATSMGATVIGDWDTEGYEFGDTEAVKDGRFVGLALDETNQREQTEERLEKWLGEIRESLLAAAAA